MKFNNKQLNWSEKFETKKNNSSSTYSWILNNDHSTSEQFGYEMIDS